MKNFIKFVCYLIVFFLVSFSDAFTIENKTIENKAIENKTIENKVEKNIEKINNNSNLEEKDTPKKEVSNKEKFLSIMFNQKEQEIIEKAYIIYKRNALLYKDEIVSENNNINIQKSQEDIGETKIINSLMLNSIMFKNINMWTIWLNKKPFTNIDNNTIKTYKIIEITNNHVKLKWVLNEEEFKILNKNKNILASRYEIDNDGNIAIELTLSPNQQYLAFLDRIVEGEYKEKKMSKKQIGEEEIIPQEVITEEAEKEEKEIDTNNLDLLLQMLEEENK